MNNISYSLKKLEQNFPLLFKIILFYSVAEIIIVLVLPSFIPKSEYLSIYLSEQSKEKTKLFFQNQNSLIPDKILGWKNHPNLRRGNWVIDKHGSRATHEFTYLKNKKAMRVLFLGSSMVNGGTRITNDETISALLEDENIETINFGTMMYSLDQVLLSYRQELYKYNAGIIVIGIDIEPVAGLKNHYIPFRYPAEENVPYIKPRFGIKSGNLHLIGVDPEKMLDDIENNKYLIPFLSENDYFYYKFSSFCHLGMLPVSGGIRHVYLKLRNLYKYFGKDINGEILLKRLVKEIDYLTSEHGAKAIFLMNTDETTYYQKGIHKYLPDLYGRELNMLKSESIIIIDVRKIFRNSGRDSEMLFDVDRSHYSAQGNKLIAETIKSEIAKYLQNNLSTN